MGSSELEERAGGIRGLKTSGASRNHGKGHGVSSRSREKPLWSYPRWCDSRAEQGMDSDASFKSWLSHFLAGCRGRSPMLSIRRQIVLLVLCVRFKCIPGGALSLVPGASYTLSRRPCGGSSRNSSCNVFVKNPSRASLGKQWPMDQIQPTSYLGTVHKLRMVWTFLGVPGWLSPKSM